ncbi:MAG: hypothetical protein ACR2GR_08805 [Rhodothermales bacterium]
MRIVFLLFWTSLFATGAVAQELNFEVTTFYAVNGQDVYEGGADADARARILSDGQQLYLEVDVTDDVVVTGPGELSGDRVEVWFALPGADGVDDAAAIAGPFAESPVATPPAVPPVYVMADSSRLYWYDHTADVDSFRQEAANPHIILGGQEYDYADLATPGRRNWIKDEVDALIAEARQGSYRQAHLFYGITHLGFFPDGRRAFLYDRDRYELIEEQAGVQLGPLAESVRYTASETTGGYQIRAQVPPEALAFFLKAGLSEMTVLIDVVDIDEIGSKATLLSSAQGRAWGRPSTFDRFTIRPPLSKPIYPSLGYLGVGAPDESQQYFWERFPEVYMRTGAGWEPVARQWETLYAATRRMLVELPNIQQVTFQRSIFDHLSQRTGNHTVQVFDVADDYATTGRQALVVIDGDEALTAEQVVEVFTFGDGNPGLLTASYEYYERGCLSDLSITCGCSVTSTLELRRPLDPSHQPVRVADYSSCTGELRVGERVLAENTLRLDATALEERRSNAFGPRFAWEELISVEGGGQRLELFLDKETRFRIAWNDEGRDIKVEER